MKKVFVISIVILIIIILVFWYILCNKKEEIEKYNFKELIQYRTDSINDTKKLDKILDNTELSQYIVKKEKIIDNGKEQLIIYYDCTDEDKVKEFWQDAQKNDIMEENSVILFSLIDNLEKVQYKFSVSNKELTNRWSYLSKEIIKEYDRETINFRYNQDVRNYINNPDKFLQYNMDLNINQITIYKINYTMESSKIEINDEEKINKIKEFIEQQNFGVNYEPNDGMIDTIIDFHNGYVIEIYANSDNAIIIKGSAKDIINNYNNSNNGIYKTLPKGMKEYLNSLVIYSQQ